MWCVRAQGEEGEEGEEEEVEGCGLDVDDLVGGYVDGCSWAER